MKNKIFIFIIGLLVGAIITAAGFLIYQNVNKSTNQMPSGEQMQMMEKPDGEPPEKPSGTESESNKKEQKSKNKTSSDNNTAKNTTN